MEAATSAKIAAAPAAAVSKFLAGEPGFRYHQIVTGLLHPRFEALLASEGQVLVTLHAGEVFGNRQKAWEWLRCPHPALDGKTPLEAATTEEGFQEVEDILGRIEYGVLG